MFRVFLSDDSGRHSGPIRTAIAEAGTIVVTGDASSLVGLSPGRIKSTKLLVTEPIPLEISVSGLKILKSEQLITVIQADVHNVQLIEALAKAAIVTGNNLVLVNLSGEIPSHEVVDNRVLGVTKRDDLEARLKQQSATSNAERIYATLSQLCITIDRKSCIQMIKDILDDDTRKSNTSSSERELHDTRSSGSSCPSAFSSSFPKEEDDDSDYSEEIFA